MRKSARGGKDYDGLPIRGHDEADDLATRQHEAWLRASGAARKILDECQTQEEIDAAMIEYRRAQEMTP